MSLDGALLSFAQNVIAMKRFITIILSLICFSFCSDNPGVIGLRRGDCLKRNIQREIEPVMNSFKSHEPDTLVVEDSLVFPVIVEEPEIPPVIYACGVENPESEKPVFVLFKDGVRAAEFALDGASVDADAHFLNGADMYITVTVGKKTMIYKNGQLRCAYDGREYISALFVRPDGLWTLGVDRNGDGFALRRDGEAVFAKSAGTPGRLYEDEGHLYFDYSITVGGKTLRYLVKDGDDFALTAPYGGELLAVTVFGGEMWFLESCDGGWLLSCGSAQYRYASRPGFGFRSAELYGTPDGCDAIINLVALAFGMPAELVCSGEEEWLKGGGSGSYHYYACEPDVHITFTKNMERLAVSSFGDGNMESIEGVRFEGGRCAMQYAGQIYLACTPTDGSPPFIWKRGDGRMNLDLNGYLTGIYVEAPE